MRRPDRYLSFKDILANYAISLYEQFDAASCRLQLFTVGNLYISLLSVCCGNCPNITSSFKQLTRRDK